MPRQRQKIPTPEMVRHENDVKWMNFIKTASMIGCDPISLSDFVEKTLDVKAFTLDGILLIKGRFSAHQVQVVLKKYIAHSL